MGFLKKLFKPVKKVISAVFKPVAKLLKKWLAPKVPPKEALQVERAGSDIEVPVVYGTRLVGGIRVDINVSDSSGGLQNENLHALYVFCHGEIDGFTEFFFNDIPSTDDRFKKDGQPMFAISTALGTEAQTPLAAGSAFNRWSATESHYKGLAIAIITFKQDPDATIWNGEPQVSAIVRGKKCLDFRTGQTVYTENPALHLYDYVRSPVYGIGLPGSAINLASLTAVANIADTNQTATVDTQVCQIVNGVYVCTGSPAEVVNFKRFSNNNIIDTSRTVFDNVQELANPFRGFFPDSDGRLSVGTEIEGSPVFFFSADNIASSITSTQPSIRDRFNRVVVRFPNKLNKYKMDEVFYPPAGALYSQWLAEDNGLSLEQTITADYTTYKAEALQLAELAAKASRNAETVQFTATAEAMQCDIGDIIAITEENRGWINKTFRISEITYRDDYYVDITAIQHENGIYPWSATSYTEIIGGTNLGDPSNIAAPTALAIAADPTLVTAGLLSWTAQNNAFIRRFEITVLRGADIVYRTESLASNWPVPLFAPADYSIQVRAVSSIGTVSPAATIAFTLAQPAMPSDINFTLGNFEIEARPVLAGAGLGTTFEFAIGDTSVIRGRGASIVFTGLLHSTTYTVFARTVNALGISAWFSKEATTTADGSNIVDLIGGDIGASIFDDVVVAVNAELTETVEAATADKLNATQVQVLIDDSIALVNDADSEDIRVELVNSALSVLSDFDTRAKLRRVDVVIAGEQQTRAAAILQLNANDQAQLQRIDLVETNLNGTNQALSQVSAQVNNPATGLSASFDLAQQAKTTADGAANSTSLLQNQINDPTTGLTATTALAQQAKTTADGNTDALNTLTATINNPATGLAATSTLAQQAKFTADGALSSATSVTNTVNDPTTGLAATTTLAQQAKTTADGNTSAIAGLRTAVAGTDSQSQAELVLTATVDKANQSFARAFLGVTTTVGGVSRINGIVVDGATNTLEFRADTLRLTNTAGVNQLYFDSGRGKWVFNGDLVAATFQTATSGFRAEMSGAGAFPFWYGSGTKDLANALFAVDLGGNVVMRNATINNATINNASITGTLNGVDGTFNGVVNIVRGSNRIRIDPSSDVMFWFGSNSVPVGSQSRNNAIFFIDSNGSYTAPKSTFMPVVDAQFTASTLTRSFSITHNSVRGVASLLFVVNKGFGTGTTAGTRTGTVFFRVFKNGTQIGGTDVNYRVEGGLGVFVMDAAILSISDNNTSLSYGQAVEYTLQIELTNPSIANLSVLINGMLSINENPTTI